MTQSAFYAEAVAARQADIDAHGFAPHALEQDGETLYQTGRYGTDIATGLASVEFSDLADRARAWYRADGAVVVD